MQNFESRKVEQFFNKIQQFEQVYESLWVVFMFK
jgi:hypothetical protein